MLTYISHKTEGGVHVDLFPFKLRTPKFGIFSARVFFTEPLAANYLPSLASLAF
jgi:hypothetical protein